MLVAATCDEVPHETTQYRIQFSMRPYRREGLQNVSAVEAVIVAHAAASCSLKLAHVRMGDSTPTPGSWLLSDSPV